MLAVLNGLLIQIIMASRVLYGMSAAGWLSAWFMHIHPRTRTPVRATVFCAAIVMLLAIFFSIEILAETTSLVVFAISTMDNAALFKLKKEQPAPENTFSAPIWVPVVGFFVSLLFTIFVAVDLSIRLLNHF